MRVLRQRRIYCGREGAGGAETKDKLSLIHLLAFSFFFSPIVCIDSHTFIFNGKFVSFDLLFVGDSIIFPPN